MRRGVLGGCHAWLRTAGLCGRTLNEVVLLPVPEDGADRSVGVPVLRLPARYRCSTACSSWLNSISGNIACPG